MTYKRNRFPILLIFLGLFFTYSFEAFASAPDLMSLQEVEKMIDKSSSKAVDAYFESVPRGTKLKNYNVTLRGVYHEPGLSVIMFVSSDKIVAGMSGSPVYVNGKLIGALAYSFNSFNFSNYSWGGISPISSMMSEADSSITDAQMPLKAFNYEGMAFHPIDLGNQLIPSFASTPEFSFLAGIKLSISTQSSGQSMISASSGNKLLNPGMPIVVDLIEWIDEKGEITTVSAMGTITYVDDDGRIFAFGHPFLNAKNVVYAFRTAEVMGTVFSEGGSFKLGGRKSEVLGAITYDSTYGIYGAISSNKLGNLHRFNLEFKKEDNPIHTFKIRVADSILTPLLAQSAFESIGQANGAPIPQEQSVTQMEATIEIKDHKPIVWKELFTSESARFGVQTLYASSYKIAYESFFSGIYSLLFNNKYGLEVLDVSVSANFITGPGQVFKLGAYKFPAKITWGQDPVLEVLFVSQDNLMAIAKKSTVKIDWSKVEKPVYSGDTLDTEKSSEKIVRGMLSITSVSSFIQGLTSSERQLLMPEYFLGPEDFLDNLSRRLEMTNQRIFVKVELRARSGLFNEAIQNAEDIMPKDVPENGDSGWYFIEGGLKDRKRTVRNESSIIFYLDLPNVPSGYVVDQNMREGLFLEVVLENKTP